jgi:hypothetical protein
VAEPLIATDALQSLVAPEIAEPLISAYAPVIEAKPLDLDLGFVPLPAPPPLLPPEQQPAVVDLMAAPAEPVADGMPRARVLMTREPGNSAFLTQLYGQN